MFFDSPYYLQSSVGLEALYYRAAIELLQCDCELGAMEMMCRAIPDDKLKKVDMRKNEIIQEHVELFETASPQFCRKAKEFLTELEDDVYNSMLEAGRITKQADKSEVITKLAKKSDLYEDVVRLIEQRKEHYIRARRNTRLRDKKVYSSAILVVDVSNNIRCLRDLHSAKKVIVSGVESQMLNTFADFLRRNGELEVNIEVLSNTDSQMIVNIVA